MGDQGLTTRLDERESFRDEGQEMSHAERESSNLEAAVGRTVRAGRGKATVRAVSKVLDDGKEGAGKSVDQGTNQRGLAGRENEQAERAHREEEKAPELDQAFLDQALLQPWTTTAAVAEPAHSTGLGPVEPLTSPPRASSSNRSGGRVESEQAPRRADEDQVGFQHGTTTAVSTPGRGSVN